MFLQRDIDTTLCYRSLAVGITIELDILCNRKMLEKKTNFELVNLHTIII